MMFDPSEILASAAAWKAGRDEQAAREQDAESRKQGRREAFRRVLTACGVPPSTGANRAIAEAVVEFRGVLEKHGRLERAAQRTMAFGRPSYSASHGWNYATALVAAMFDGSLASVDDLRAALDRFVDDVTKHGLMIDLGNDRILDMLKQALSLPLSGVTLDATDEEVAAEGAAVQAAPVAIQTVAHMPDEFESLLDYVTDRVANTRVATVNAHEWAASLSGPQLCNVGVFLAREQGLTQGDIARLWGEKHWLPDTRAMSKSKKFAANVSQLAKRGKAKLDSLPPDLSPTDNC